MVDMANRNPLSDTFETINQSTGGMAGQVGVGLTSAGRAATVDVAKGVAKAPVDIVREILGDESGADPDETSGAGVGGGGDDPAADSGQGDSAALMKKIEEDRKQVSDKLRQQRMVLAEEREQYEKSVRAKQQEEKQQESEEKQKKTEIVQLEVRKKQESLAVTNAKLMGGSHEVARKIF